MNTYPKNARGVHVKSSKADLKYIFDQGQLGGPQGFWGSGENDYLFSGSKGALVIILGEQGHRFGDLGSPSKKQNKKKNKGKPPFCFDF